MVVSHIFCVHPTSIFHPFLGKWSILTIWYVSIRVETQPPTTNQVISLGGAPRCHGVTNISLERWFWTARVFRLPEWTTKTQWANKDSRWLSGINNSIQFYSWIPMFINSCSLKCLSKFAFFWHHDHIYIYNYPYANILPVESTYQVYKKNNLSFPPPNRLLGIDLRLSQESPLAILHELREVEDTLGILLYLGQICWDPQ